MTLPGAARAFKLVGTYFNLQARFLALKRRRFFSRYLRALPLWYSRRVNFLLIRDLDIFKNLRIANQLVLWLRFKRTAWGKSADFFLAR